jgi:hypothetical protein
MSHDVLQCEADHRAKVYPLLLAALERLTACPDVSLRECEQETYDALNQAREAIAQATGEE